MLVLRGERSKNACSSACVSRALVVGREVRVRHEDAGDCSGYVRGDQIVDVRGDVLAVGEVALVAEHVGHERVHRRREPRLGDIGPSAYGDENAKPGRLGDDDVEVGQQVGEVELQAEQVRPAVHRRGARGHPRCADCRCTKCTVASSISARNCGCRLSHASRARQSKSSQDSTSERR